MEELRHLDEVAYVRFASVYRQFEDVEAFHEEIKRLRSARAAPAAGAHVRAHKREGRRAANREQLPLLPAEEPSDEQPGPGGKK
jgi:hypothetical protein